MYYVASYTYAYKPRIHTYIRICTYTMVLATISTIANPTPTISPRTTPKNTVPNNTTIHMNYRINKAQKYVCCLIRMPFWLTISGIDS